MSVFDEIIQSYIETKVKQELDIALRKITTALEARINMMSLGERNYNDLITLINNMRRIIK